MAERRLIPVSAVIPTRNRQSSLRETLKSLSNQSVQPSEIIIVDASEDHETEDLSKSVDKFLFTVNYKKAASRGAASQRNEGVALARFPYIFFMDDDLLFEEKCLERLFSAIEENKELGGVNAMITNQKYSAPGKISRLLFGYLNGKKLDSYAGKCIGPVMNLLPDDNDKLPEVVPVEWLNTTCTFYRTEALPVPPFPNFFTGYSMFEDVTVSMTVGKSWKLANVRLAKVYHDSQPGDHKKSIFLLSKMELVNRYYVMTKVINRRGFSNKVKLMVTEFYKVSSYLHSLKGIKEFPFVIFGKFVGVIEILKMTKHAD
ncbi:MAG: glycosyltransferase family 2 protein [Cyclobacteriaceae bacterium]